MNRLEEPIELLLHASRECMESDNSSDPCFNNLRSYKQLIRELYREKADRLEELEKTTEALEETRRLDAERQIALWEGNQRYKRALEDARKNLLLAINAYDESRDFHVNYKIQEAILNINDALREGSE